MLHLASAFSCMILAFESGHLNSCTGFHRDVLVAQPVPYSWAFTLCLSLFALINAATDIVGAKARTVLCAVGLTSTIRPPKAQRAGAVSPHSGPRITSSACPSGPVMDAWEPMAWGTGQHRPSTDSCSPGDWGATSAVSSPTAWQRGRPLG